MLSFFKIVFLLHYQSINCYKCYKQLPYTISLLTKKRMKGLVRERRKCSNDIQFIHSVFCSTFACNEKTPYHSKLEAERFPATPVVSVVWISSLGKLRHNPIRYN